MYGNNCFSHIFMKYVNAHYGQKVEFFNVDPAGTGLKLNGTHQLLVYAGDVNILGGSVHNSKGKRRSVDSG
jgi:hypothetical protein